MKINRSDHSSHLDLEIASSRHNTGRVAAVRDSASESTLAPLRINLEKARKAFRDGDLRTTGQHASKVIAAVDDTENRSEAIAIAGSAQVLAGHVADAAGDTDAADAAYRNAIHLLRAAREVVWARGDHVADLGAAMVMLGLPDADDPLRRAQQMGEDTVVVRRYLGLYQLSIGRLAEAKKLLSDVARRVPSDWRAYRGLATIAKKEGLVEEAIELWLQAATAAEAVGRLRDALAAYRAADELAPSLDAKRGIAAVLPRLNLFDEAKQAAEDILAVDPDDYDTRIVYVEALLGLKLPHDAAAVARELAVSHSQDPVPHAYLGMALREIGDNGEAVDALSTAHQLRPDSGPIRLELADALRAANRIDEAIHVLDEGLAQDPRDVNLHLLRAEVAADSGDLDIAESHVVTVDEIDPASAPWLWLSRVITAHGDVARALSAVDHALRVDPDDSSALGMRGVLLVDQGEIEDGITTLRASLGVQPLPPTIYDLASALLRRGQDEDKLEAEELARRYIVMEPEDPDGAILLARALWLAERTPEAATVLDDAAQRFSPCGTVERLRMWVLLDSGRTSEAVEAAERAKELLSDDAQTLAQVGRFFCGLVDSEPDASDRYASAAIDSLTRAIELDSDDFDSMGHLGRLQWRRNDCVLAEKLLADAIALREAAGVEPDVELLNVLARIWLDRDDPERALSTVEAILALDPEYHDSLATRGEALYFLERYAESADAFHRALAAGGKNSYVLGWLGESYRMLNNLDAADRALNEALEYQPDNLSALTSRGALNNELGNVEAAAADLCEVIEKAPTYMFALSQYSGLLLEQGRVRDAVPVWRTAVDKAPGSVEIRIQYADTLRLAGELADGLEQAEKALESEPTNELGLRVLGRTLVALGRIDEGAAQFERAQALHHDSVSVAIDLAEARDRQGRPLAALHTIQEALDREPRIDLFIDNGWRYARLAAWDHASACAKRALEMAPAHHAGYGLSGWVLLLQNRIDDGLAAAEQALRLAPEFMWNHKQLGNALWAAGRIDDAIPEFEWVAEREERITDNDAHGLHNLGWSLLCLGKHRRAATCLTKARALGFDEISVLMDLGLNAMVAGQTTEGIDTYGEALSMIDRARSGRRKNSGEAALLFRGSIAVAIYDLETFLGTERLEASPEIETVIGSLHERLSALPLPL